MRDLTWREVAVVAPLIVLIVVLGVYPKPVLDRITPSVTRLVQHVETSHGHPPARRGHRGASRPVRPPPSRRGRRPGARRDRRPSAVLGLDRAQIAYLSILPVLVMLGGAVVLLAVSSLQRRRMDPTVRPPPWRVLTAAGGARRCRSCSGSTSPTTGPTSSIDPAVVEDGFSVLRGRARVVRGAARPRWWPTAGCGARGVAGPEFHVLMLLSASGAMLMGQANDLIVVFLGLEILSIALYVLRRLQRPAGRVGRGGAQVLHPRRRSPRRSSSTASPWSTGPRARPT